MNFDKESILFYVVVSIFAVTAIVTILGIIQKVSIEKHYLNKLFTALILELVATVIYMTANMDISSQENIDTTDRSNPVLNITQIKSSAVDDFILTLPSDIQGSVIEVRSNLQEKYLELAEVNNQLKLAKDQITLLKQQSVSKDGFLNKVSELEAIRVKLENTINLEHKEDEKYDVYILIQKILHRIGHYDGAIDGDALTTQESLESYKLDVGLADDRYLKTVTQQTVIYIVRDYANVLLDELAK